MLLVLMEASLLHWVFWKSAMPYVPASVSNLRTVCLFSTLFILYAVCPFHPGEPDAQRLASDFGICRGPGRDAWGSQQWCSDPDGEGRPGLPQIGERKPNGRMEILHLLRLPGVPHVERKRRRRCRDGNKGGRAGGSWKAKGRWRKGRWRKKKKDMVKMGGKHDNRLVFGTLQRKDEMLERYERDVRKLQSQHMRVYGQLLHFASSFHPSFHASFSSLCFLVAWLQLWTAKTFSILCWQIDHWYGPECSEAHV